MAQISRAPASYFLLCTLTDDTDTYFLMYKIVKIWMMILLLEGGGMGGFGGFGGFGTFVKDLEGSHFAQKGHQRISANTPTDRRKSPSFFSPSPFSLFPPAHSPPPHKPPLLFSTPLPFNTLGTTRTLYQLVIYHDQA